MAPIYWPMERGHIITSGYGPRWGTVHYGIDFGWPGGSAGKPVYACQGGTVVSRAYDAGGFGWYLDIDSPTDDGSDLYVYGHIVPEVSVGDRVEAGQRIGSVNGNRSTNGGVDPHVHVERHRYVRQPPGGGRLNPLPHWNGALFPPRAAAAAPAPAAPAAPSGVVFGVDVSEHQDGMSLRQAAREGMEYAIIRTTDGTYRDRTYRSHLDDAEAAGMITAAYHYLRNPSEGTTVQQQVSASLAVMGDAPRPMWIDVETEAGLHVDHIRECKRLFEAAGVRVIGVYSYVPYWENQVAPSEPDSHEFGAFWVAAYGQNRKGTPATLYPGNGHAQWQYPLGNQRPALWQYGSNAEVAGRLVDINAFRGTRAQLEALFTGRAHGEDWLDMASEADVRRIIREEVWAVTHDTKRICVQMGMDADDDGFGRVPGWVQGGHRSFYDLLATAVSILEAIANKVGLKVATRTFDTLADPPKNARNPKLKG